jgi:hypothetical protein
MRRAGNRRTSSPVNYNDRPSRDRRIDADPVSAPRIFVHSRQAPVRRIADALRRMDASPARMRARA